MGNIEEVATAESVVGQPGKDSYSLAELSLRSEAVELAVVVVVVLVLVLADMD